MELGFQVNLDRWIGTITSFGSPVAETGCRNRKTGQELHAATALSIDSDRRRVAPGSMQQVCSHRGMDAAGRARAHESRPHRSRRGQEPGASDECFESVRQSGLNGAALDGPIAGRGRTMTAHATSGPLKRCQRRFTTSCANKKSRWRFFNGRLLAEARCGVER